MFSSELYIKNFLSPVSLSSLLGRRIASRIGRLKLGSWTKCRVRNLKSNTKTSDIGRIILRQRISELGQDGELSSYLPEHLAQPTLELARCDPISANDGYLRRAVVSTRSSPDVYVH